jgi:hypothetical protein
MRELKIFCSRDLEDRVVEALDGAGVEGFLHVGEATGHQFAARGELPRTISWEASLFVVPALDEDKVRAVQDELAAYAGRCEVEPCLRMVVGSVERMI